MSNSHKSSKPLTSTSTPTLSTRPAPAGDQSIGRGTPRSKSLTIPEAALENLDNLDAAFPVPKPVIVRTATLRAHGRNDATIAFSIIMTVPKDLIRVARLREGDTVLIEAWADGTMRLKKAGYGL